MAYEALQLRITEIDGEQEDLREVIDAQLVDAQELEEMLAEATVESYAAPRGARDGRQGAGLEGQVGPGRSGSTKEGPRQARSKKKKSAAQVRRQQRREAERQTGAVDAVVLGQQGPGRQECCSSAAQVQRQQRREAGRQAGAVDAVVLEQQEPGRQECCSNKEERWLARIEDSLTQEDVKMIERAMAEAEEMEGSGKIAGQDGAKTAKEQSRVFDPGGAED